MFAELTVNQFLAELASGQPVPGGGSVAALSGALGCALIEMVANLTVGREKYAVHDEQMRQIRTEAGTKREELLKLIDEDSRSYQLVIEAFGLPKNSPEEKAERTKAIQTALHTAAVTPLRVARKCLEAFECVRPVFQNGNPNAASDAKVAALLLRAAVRASIANVFINLDSMKDQAIVAEMRAEGEALEEKAAQLEAQVLK